MSNVLDGRTIIPVREVGAAPALQSGINTADNSVEGLEYYRRNGWNDALGAIDYTPINSAGVYRMPTSLTSLEVLSDSADDSSAGIGARTIFVDGLVAGWIRDIDIVQMDGLTPVALSKQYYRIDRIVVVESGSYGDVDTPSNQGVITLREAGGGQTWGMVRDISGYGGLGREHMGAISIPIGQTAYILGAFITIDTNKIVSILTFVRGGADHISAPFDPVINNPFESLSGVVSYNPAVPVGPIPGPADIVLMGKGESGFSSVTVELEVIAQIT